jgi:transposase
MRLTIQQKVEIARLFANKTPCIQISKIVGCSMCAVSRWKNESKSNSTFQEISRSGRPPKLAKKITCKIIRAVKNKRRKSTRSISRNPRISDGVTSISLNYMEIAPQSRFETI